MGRYEVMPMRAKIVVAHSLWEATLDFAESANIAHFQNLRSLLGMTRYALVCYGEPFPLGHD